MPFAAQFTATNYRTIYSGVINYQRKRIDIDSLYPKLIVPYPT